jgi:hypothetical protein
MHGEMCIGKMIRELLNYNPMLVVKSSRHATVPPTLAITFPQRAGAELCLWGK